MIFDSSPAQRWVFTKNWILIFYSITLLLMVLLVNIFCTKNNLKPIWNEQINAILNIYHIRVSKYLWDSSRFCFFEKIAKQRLLKLPGEICWIEITKLSATLWLVADFKPAAAAGCWWENDDKFAESYLQQTHTGPQSEVQILWIDVGHSFKINTIESKCLWRIL